MKYVLEQLALEAGADIILLDNMSLDQLSESVQIARGRVATEASGGVNLKTVRAIADPSSRAGVPVGRDVPSTSMILPGGGPAPRGGLLDGDPLPGDPDGHPDDSIRHGDAIEVDDPTVREELRGRLVAGAR